MTKNRYVRAAAVALLGALIGAVALIIATAVQPQLAFEMDRDLLKPAFTGFYRAERAGETTFAWTGERALLKLQGLDRHAVWTCALRFRGARPEGMQQPVVTLQVDGVQASESLGTNNYQELQVSATPRSTSGLSLGIISTPTFRPGPGDPRALGIQVDRLACAPSGRWNVPPVRALVAATAAPAVLGGLIVVAGAGLGSVLLAVVALAAGIAVLLSAGAAPFTSYGPHLAWLAAAVGAGCVLLVRTTEAWQQRALHASALAAVMVSAVALVLKIGGILHPSKLLIDALFQAHRLEAVMAGQYFFTQPMPDGVQFPYAIGLYVFAALWVPLTNDHVALLRVVVVVTDVLAGGLLYLTVLRAWGHRGAAVLAVMLFHLVPLPYMVVGNGNLTNAFGQSVALVTAVLATLWSFRARRVGQVLLLAVFAALACCSHVSTCVLLSATLLALTALYTSAAQFRRQAAAVLIATALALAFSTATYYAHFTDVYVDAVARLRATTDPNTVGSTPPAVGATLPKVPAWPERAGGALRQTLADVGWPLLLLSAIGILGLRRPAADRRVPLLMGAWGLVWALFVGLGTMTRVGPQYERYAVEFLGRVNLATYPALVLLAAHSLVVVYPEEPQGRPVRLALRVAVVALICVCAVVGVGAWTNWIR